MAVKLNFDKLDSIGLAPKDFIEKANTEKAPTDPTEKPREDIGDRAEARLNNIKSENNRQAEAYREYQQNIKEAGDLRTQIIKGVQAREPVELLFLKAVKCIGKMTGEKAFYTTIEAWYR